MHKLLYTDEEVVLREFPCEHGFLLVSASSEDDGTVFSTMADKAMLAGAVSQLLISDAVLFFAVASQIVEAVKDVTEGFSVIEREEN